MARELEVKEYPNQDTTEGEKSPVNSLHPHTISLLLLTDSQWGPQGTHIVPYGAGVGVRNPGHLPLTRAHVWGRHINARTWGHKEKALYQLLRSTHLKHTDPCNFLP